MTKEEKFLRQIKGLEIIGFEWSITTKLIRLGVRGVELFRINCWSYKVRYAPEIEKLEISDSYLFKLVKLYIFKDITEIKPRYYSINI